MPWVGNAAATVVDNDLVMMKAALWIVSEPISACPALPFLAA
jgi:hypothetical protein